MQDAALASSVGHDDHNIIVVGTDDLQMAQAVNKLKEIGGGFVFVQSGAVKAVQPLPVCGLMSDLPWEEVADIQREFLKNAGTKELPDPTMALAFLALGVIPDVKLRVPDSQHPESLTRFAPGKGIDVPITWNLTNPVL
jgi:adenine deaminase